MLKIRSEPLGIHSEPVGSARNPLGIRSEISVQLGIRAEPIGTGRFRSEDVGHRKVLDHIYWYKYLDFMSVDTQFIITCSTLRIMPYPSEANQVYSLSRLILA